VRINEKALAPSISADRLRAAADATA